MRQVLDVYKNCLLTCKAVETGEKLDVSCVFQVVSIFEASAREANALRQVVPFGHEKYQAAERSTEFSVTLSHS